MNYQTLKIKAFICFRSSSKLSTFQTMFVLSVLLAIVPTFLPMLGKIQIKMLNLLSVSEKSIDTIFTVSDILYLLNF